METLNSQIIISMSLSAHTHIHISTLNLYNKYVVRPNVYQIKFYAVLFNFLPSCFRCQNEKNAISIT